MLTLDYLEVKIRYQCFFNLIFSPHSLIVTPRNSAYSYNVFFYFSVFYVCEQKCIGIFSVVFSLLTL